MNLFANSEVAILCRAVFTTAKRILKILLDKGLLALLRKGAGRRPAILAFPELIDIAES